MYLVLILSSLLLGGRFRSGGANAAIRSATPPVTELGARVAIEASENCAGLAGRC